MESTRACITQYHFLTSENHAEPKGGLGALCINAFLFFREKNVDVGRVQIRFWCDELPECFVHEQANVVRFGSSCLELAHFSEVHMAYTRRMRFELIVRAIKSLLFCKCSVAAGIFDSFENEKIHFYFREHPYSVY